MTILAPLKYLLRTYVALTGSLAAYTVGLLDRYTVEHRRFLSSGFTCGACKAFLIRKTLVADVIVYDAQGNPIPMLQARKNGKSFGCPKCGHQWKIRRPKSSE